MLAHKIREKCEERGMTLARLEVEAGIAPRNIFRWGDEQDKENNKDVVFVMPAADKLARVAAVLGTTSEELLKN